MPPACKMEHQAHTEVFYGWQVIMQEGPDLLCAGDLGEQTPAQRLPSACPVSPGLPRRARLGSFPAGKQRVRNPAPENGT